ncbi:MAG: hypothetical protein GX288_05160 [Clostridiales bacterium]|nr:hypothetical protein [Clostridiales bacterium]
MIKKYFKRTIILFLAIVCFSVVGNKEARAANKEHIELQVVNEIDNVPYPALTYIDLYGSSYRSYSEFTIHSMGQLKVILRMKVGVTGRCNIWISRDSEGLDVVGKAKEFTAQDNEASWFLESGTYYINYMSNSGINEKVGTALLFERATTEETVENSSFSESNLLELNKLTKGFITTMSPNDYYRFELKKKANVAVEYSFDGPNNDNNAVGYCSLYDENQIYLYGGTYSKSDKGQLSFNYLLEPGIYYIKMNGLYGYTTLNINPMYYDIELVSENSETWTKEPIKIKINSSIDYSEIRVVFKDVEEASIEDNDIWSINNELNVKLDGETFEATDKGIYTVRIKDKFGNYALGKIDVKNIDTKKPKVKGVKNNKAYKKAVTISWTDDLSGIDTSKVTLNDKVVKSGITVKEQGKYVLKVYDKVGNVRKVTFYVDTTAPTSGIENGKTYNSTVTLRFKDNVSGIKKILINDEEISSDTKTRRYYLDGEYVVEMWDNANNYRKQVFYIK